jgi:hypothetical protein
MSPIYVPGKVVLAKSYTAGDRYFNETSLLLHGNGTNGSATITDNSPSPKVVTPAGNAQISTAQSKFGGASIDNSTLGSYLSIPSSNAFQFDLNDFTVEFWLYFVSSATESRLIAFGGPNNTQLNLAYKNGGNRLTIVNEGVSHILVTTQDLIANSWQHIAYVRASNSLRLFFNGTQIGPTVGVASINSSVPASLIVGDGVMRGYIDDLRVTKGVARYTANFTPPTAPFADGYY